MVVLDLILGLMSILLTILLGLFIPWKTQRQIKINKEKEEISQILGLGGEIFLVHNYLVTNHNATTKDESVEEVILTKNNLMRKIEKIDEINQIKTIELMINDQVNYAVNMLKKMEMPFAFDFKTPYLNKKAINRKNFENFLGYFLLNINNKKHIFKYLIKNNANADNAEKIRKNSSWYWKRSLFIP